MIRSYELSPRCSVLLLALHTHLAYDAKNDAGRTPLEARRLIVIIFLLLLHPVSALSQTRSIYVGLVSITPTNAPVLAAVDGGYFRKHGVDVKPLIMAGSSTALAAMLSGEVNFVKQISAQR